LNTGDEFLTRLALKVDQLLSTLPSHSCPLENNVPSDGVYIFYEKKPDGAWRVSRIGTHSRENGLVRRLTDHYFSDKNNSIFRKHLGHFCTTGTCSSGNAQAVNREEKEEPALA
jgi:hypothetical protein